ncbi:MAG: CPBP family intramembrane glutamic endopeptidase [Candidatus Wenzhouxiangella sp. M2_3B_020]
MHAEGDNARSSKLSPHRFLGIALAFELGLGVLAIALALLFGLRPWLDLDWRLSVLPVAVAATLPMAGLIPLVSRAGWQWAERLRRLIRERLLPAFSGLRWWALPLISLAAGVGEELLFRGVLQSGLTGPTGPAIALITASLLFGAAHALTPAYFILATGIGFYLGGLYIATGNLLVPVLVHSLYDWLALAWLLSRTPNED